MTQPNQPTVLDGDTVVIGHQDQPGALPPVPADVRQWLEDDQVDAVDLGSAREKGVIPTTWHQDL